MCKRTTHFKLCTCPHEMNVPEEFWTYESEKHLNARNGIIGEAIRPYIKGHTTIEQLAAKMEHDLNHSKVFDLPMDFSKGDCIRTQLLHDGKSYELIFKFVQMNQWKLQVLIEK